MKKTGLLRELRQMRFTDIYNGYQSKRLSQSQAAEILGVSDRTFRRYMARYEEEGLEGLVDHRATRISHRRAPVDEVIRVQEQYRSRYMGWNAKHFYQFYQRSGGSRSYTWVKNTLQSAKLISKAPAKGKHRRRRERAPMEGMRIHQDGSQHLWIPGVYWDLIVTMDDATNEHYSMFFVAQEGTLSSFQGVKEVIEKKGLFCSFYSDRGSHYWHTPTAGGKVDKHNLTQFGEAMKQLGIEMIAAYSPEARGRSERMFRTHQERLPKELKLHGIKTIEGANKYLRDIYMPAFNREFTVIPKEEASAFVEYRGNDLDDCLCEKHERVVGNDNCVQFEKIVLQIPETKYRHHYRKIRVRVHRYANGDLAIFHGPRKLATYTAKGEMIENDKRKIAA